MAIYRGMVIFAPKNWNSSIFLYFNVMKIKNLFYALMVPFAFLAFWACQDEPVLPPAVNLAEDQATINAGGEETSVLIKPTRDWTATVAEDGKWLTVTPSEILPPHPRRTAPRCPANQLAALSFFFLRKKHR